MKANSSDKWNAKYIVKHMLQSTTLLNPRSFLVKSATLRVLLAACCLSAGSCSSNTNVSEDIVARVNGKEITESDLDKQYQGRIAGAPQQPTPEEAQALKFQLLTQMVNDEILLQMAASSGLNATDAEVETKFTDLKSQYTEEQFQEMLKAQKVKPEDVKNDMRKSLTLEKLVTKEITSRVNVSDAEIQDVYEKNKESFNLPEGYHLQHIMVTPYQDQQIANVKRDDAKSPAEAQAKAARLLRDIQGGLDFAVVARDWSEDPDSAPNGGDLSFRSLEDLEKIDPKLRATVQRLKVGESSPLIETRYGFHILKLLARDPGGQKELANPQVQAQIRKVIFNQKQEMLRAAFSEVARNKAQVNNYLAERLLESAGKASTPVAGEAKKEDAKPEEKKPVPATPPPAPAPAPK